jgi:hypothetical protein
MLYNWCWFRILYILFQPAILSENITVNLDKQVLTNLYVIGKNVVYLYTLMFWDVLPEVDMLQIVGDKWKEWWNSLYDMMVVL